MAPYAATQLLALSCVVLFGHASHLLGHHSLAEQSRLSIAVVLGLSAAFCLIASCCSRLFPFGNGRFAGGRHQARDGHPNGAATDQALLSGSDSHLPDRPRRYTLPALIFCVVLRLEILQRVSSQQQCASPGIQSLLCPLLVGCDIFLSRKRWGVPPIEYDDDPWRSFFDDLHDWFTGPRVTMVVMLASVCIFSLGTYLSACEIARSTFICFTPLDSSALTLLWQFLGLLVDAAIITLLWRTLAWTRTTKQRLRVLTSVFGISALASVGLWLCRTVFGGFHRHDFVFGFLDGFDYLVDSASLAIFVACLGLWICETSFITPVSILTFLAGIWFSIINIAQLDDWIHLSRAGSLFSLWLIAFGTVLFTYTHDVRSVVFVPRPLLTFLFMVLIFVATIITLQKQRGTIEKLHPINDLIFQAQTEHSRWLIEAGTSQSLSVAVKVYEERHAGRAAPPNFAEWYEYAAESPVKDNYKQIDEDLEPFWGVTPEDLRCRVKALSEEPGVSVITIKDGDVGRRVSGGEDESRDLNELVEMIQKFSTHLPDMVLPINLSPSPRVLPSWKDIHLRNSGSKRWPEDPRIKHSGEPRDGEESPRTAKPPLTPASKFRQMQQEACPPKSRERTRQHWSFEQFCTACVKHYSQGQHLSDFQRSLDVCSQPDLKYLHGFSLTDKRSPVIRQLVPLFGPSKTAEFRDIMIPLPRSRLEKPDIPWQFLRRYDNLFWRGTVGNDDINGQTLRGSQKFRLLHLLNRPHAQDRVTMVLPKADNNESFGAESVSAAEASRALPISVGMTDYSSCAGEGCEVIKLAFGTEADTEEALEYRYILLTDEDDGPPSELLRTIRSGSVPFVSTIFRSWYTERLVPWLHFVPIDIRYHALHTTFAYFTGTRDRPKINNRETQLLGREGDGEWISRRGQKWAEQALSKNEMEVYLFRLLLEWGRLIDDRRDDIGYRRKQGGSFENEAWTQQR
ncbi:glycosyltransferase family 90 protein [Ophiocordyceps camponoti-floridani]|uniref:Glycosyltransferase family 90 protein n=1 Tax=Ophiocordyceps camponoti-floridani TaxID=2030778 RepID=A0A8H4Q8A6_9HYPO|nr:glycosyltransferase family 90 protein [Ophiocordyceps camponoti-floridani]